MDLESTEDTPNSREQMQCIRSKNVWIAEKQEFLEAAIFIRDEIIHYVLLCGSITESVEQYIQENYGNIPVLDYENSYILPGLIDTNVSLHIGNDWEEIEQTSRLFSMGGVTTIACQPLLMNPEHLDDEYSALTDKMEIIQGKSAVDYCFFANLYEKNISDIARLHSLQGVAGFKVYLNPPVEPGAGWVESKTQMMKIAAAVAGFTSSLESYGHIGVSGSSTASRFGKGSSEVLLNFHAVKSGGKELTITSPLRQRNFVERLDATVKRTEGDSILGETSKKSRKDDFSDDNDSDSISMSEISNCVNDKILDLNGEEAEDEDDMPSKPELNDILLADITHPAQNPSALSKLSLQETHPTTDTQSKSTKSPLNSQSIDRQKFLKLYAKATIHSSDNLQQQLIARAEMKTYTKDTINGDESDENSKISSESNRGSSSNSRGSNESSDDEENNCRFSFKHSTGRQRHQSCIVSNAQLKRQMQKEKSQQMMFTDAQSIELSPSPTSPVNSSISYCGNSPKQSDSNSSTKRHRRPSNSSVEATGTTNDGFIPFPSANAASYSFDFNMDLSISPESSSTQLNNKASSKIIRMQKVLVDSEQQLQLQQQQQQQEIVVSTNSIIINRSAIEEDSETNLQKIEEQIDSDPEDQFPQNMTSSIAVFDENLYTSTTVLSSQKKFPSKKSATITVMNSITTSPLKKEKNLSPSSALKNTRPKAHTAIQRTQNSPIIQMCHSSSNSEPLSNSNSSKMSVTPFSEADPINLNSQSISQRKPSSYTMKRPMKLVPDLKRSSFEQSIQSSSSPFNQYSPKKPSLMKQVFDKKDSVDTKESDSVQHTRSSVEDMHIPENDILVADADQSQTAVVAPIPRIRFEEKRRSFNISVAVDSSNKIRKESMGLTIKSEDTGVRGSGSFDIQSNNSIPEPSNPVPDSRSSSEQDPILPINRQKQISMIGLESTNWSRKVSSESAGNPGGLLDVKDNSKNQQRRGSTSYSFNRDYLTFLAFRPPYWEYFGVTLIKDSFVKPLITANLKASRIRILFSNIGNSNSISRISALKDEFRKKSNRIHVYSETAAAFLYFSADNIRHGQTAFKCEPPIGTKDNMEFLVNASKLNMIDAIGSYHFPVEEQFKSIEDGDFRKAFSGICTAGCTLQSAWTALYNSYKKSTEMLDLQSLLQQKQQSELITNSTNTPHRKTQALLKYLVNMMCTKPARILNISHMKGSIAKGKYADLVVWDPFAEESRNRVPSNYRFQSVHIFHRKKFAGKVQATFLRGTLIYEAADETQRSRRKASAQFNNIPLTGKLLSKQGVL